MTATAIAGTRNSRHRRQPAGSDFCLDFAGETRDDHGVRIRVAFPLARAAAHNDVGDCGHADVTVPDARRFPLHLTMAGKSGQWAMLTRCFYAQTVRRVAMFGLLCRVRKIRAKGDFPGKTR
jgi:hypothetical protein